MRNIVLIGMPGSGKTEIGRLAAARLCREYVDLDELIEKKAGMAITEIFAIHGESYFRNIETEIAREVSDKSGFIISTGGGVVQNAENMRLLSQNGLIIYINRDIEKIKTADFSARPLLKDNPERLHTLFEQREKLYMDYADETLENNGSIEQAVDGLCRFAKMDDHSFFVIGDPIAHSLSPYIHNTVFGEVGFSASYGAARVKKGSLEGFINRMKHDDRGFNVTMPHKTDIIPYLDEIDDEAEICSSVNTVTVNGGKLCGYNTDMNGLAAALFTKGFSFFGKRVLIIGAGGVANTVAVKAALDGAVSIALVARTLQKAQMISDRVLTACSSPRFRHVFDRPFALQRRFPTETCADYDSFTPIAGQNISSRLQQTQDVEQATNISHIAAPPEVFCGGMELLACRASAADVLINTTPLGMTGIQDDFECLDFLQNLHKHALVCDLIYSPPETKLLKEAARLGLETQNGLPMLIYQALFADKLFMGEKYDFDIDALAKKLAGSMEETN